MNGSGCKNCPVENCETMHYRGSTCAAQRAKLGLGDPKTNYDRIRGMSVRELAVFIRNDEVCPGACVAKCGEYDTCDDCWEAWLLQEVDND